MFSGIIESVGIVKELDKKNGNLHISVFAPFANDLKIDQSVSHNGACLTVIKKKNKIYTVIAIDETLQKTCLGKLKEGDEINLERALKVGDRLDGHIVQGHVDTTAICKKIKSEKGSWIFSFSHKKSKKFIMIEKGSVCVNGVSLTVVHSANSEFSVAIIPYTFENTTFKNLKVGDSVNVEFDVVGKYISRMMDL